MIFAPDPQVLHAQHRLAELHFDPGIRNGRLTKETRTALVGFQQLNGIKPEGVLNARTLRALKHPRKVRGRFSDGVEVDLGRQLLFVYRDGKPALITHVSTGAERHYCERGHCGYAITPVGDFSVFRRIKGWHRGALGAMYSPVYFRGGIAIHGSVEVPKHPASHGCVRVPLYVAPRVFHLVKMGETVRVRE
ncbi:MAG: murein L,D-transpeptidase [Nonomuraea sp.]|nr:murein L,D-transpeptidase [Nonomuraea sp.]